MTDAPEAYETEKPKSKTMQINLQSPALAKLVELLLERPTKIVTRNEQGAKIQLEIFICDDIVHLNHTGSRLEKGQIDQISMAFKAWWLGLHWFIKSEETKHKIPRKGVKRPKLYEPIGIYLKHIFMLCEGCKSRENLFGWQYELPQSVGDWFWFIWQEIIGEEVFYVLNKSERGVKEILEINNIKVNGRCLKRTYVRQHLLESVNAASNYKNPYDYNSLPNQQWRNSGHLYRAMLLQAAITLANQFTGFDRSLYKPFITAWRNNISVKESDEYKLARIKKGDLYVNEGKALINLSCKSPQERYIIN